MKGFHKNYRRLENEIFILYMSNHELVIALNLSQNTNSFEFSLFGMGYLQNLHARNRTKPYSMPCYFDKILLYLFLSKSSKALSEPSFLYHFYLVFRFKRYIDQFRFFLFLSIDSFAIMYGSRGLCVYIDPVRGLTKMCKSSICLRHSTSLFLFAYGIATPFGSIL